MVNPLLNEVRAIAFDAVGTVIHPQPPATVVYADVGRRFGSKRSGAEIVLRFTAAFDHEEAVDQANGLQTSEVREVERWCHIVGEVLDDVTVPAACFRELFEHFSRADSWICDADAAATIETLNRRGYALGMASNYDGRLRSVVAGLPPLAPLQRLIISSEVGWRKPSPQFFLAVCQAFHFPAQSILYIGDDPANDYDGARAAGLRAVLYDPNAKHQGRGYLSVKTLSELAAD
jgi:putative hydrolase of the HAD superfamily